jgi:ribokinase
MVTCFMNSKARLLVVGSYATGLVMETSRIPKQGETLIGRNYRECHGGKGSNQAVQAARLGADVAFVACVGRDARGDAMDTLMRGEGVRLDGVIRHVDLPTGVGFIIVDEKGNNLITVDLGANNALSAGDLEADRTLFEAASVVLAQLEIPSVTALTAMRLGKQCGATTILNPAPATDLSGSDLSGVDYVIPNETEATTCAGMPESPLEEAMRHLNRLGCRNVVTTTGEKGCLWLSESGFAEIPGFEAGVVDTVGAGDSFCGAFAVGLGENMRVEEALRFAHAAASLSVTKPDTIPSYHDRAAVDAIVSA